MIPHGCKFPNGEIVSFVLFYFSSFTPAKGCVLAEKKKRKEMKRRWFLSLVTFRTQCGPGQENWPLFRTEEANFVGKNRWQLIDIEPHILSLSLSLSLSHKPHAVAAAAAAKSEKLGEMAGQQSAQNAKKKNDRFRFQELISVSFWSFLSLIFFCMSSLPKGSLTRFWREIKLIIKTIFTYLIKFTFFLSNGSLTRLKKTILHL